MRTHFVGVVWGHEYIERMLTRAVPALMMDSNLGNSRFRDSELHLYVSETEDSPALPALIDALERGFVGKTYVHKTSVEGNKYVAMTAAHEKGQKQASDEGAYTAFLSPDSIVSEGFYSVVDNLVEAGAEAVQGHFHRMSLETYLPWFDSVRNGKPTLKRLLRKEHMHPWSKSCFFDAQPISSCPSPIHWDFGDFFVARSYYLGPFALKPCSVVHERTCDYNLVSQSCNFDKIAYIADSDVAHGVELSHHDYMSDTFRPLGEKYNLATLRQHFIDCNAEPLHLYNFEQLLVFRWNTN